MGLLLLSFKGGVHAALTENQRARTRVKLYPSQEISEGRLLSREDVEADEINRLGS